MSLEIAGRPIGVGHPLFVIAELGLNHGGSLERALALVDAAADAGASAVKVQTFRSDELVSPVCAAPAHVPASSLQAFFRQFELDERAHGVIRDRARARDVAFMATAFSRGAVAMLERVGVDAYKIASGDITFHDLIAACARTGKPVVLSTGMANLDETRAAIAVAREAGASALATLHCVSAYPVPLGHDNLRAIATLHEAFGGVVGLSDHGTDPLTVALAVALGASVYERHLMLPGDDGVDRAVSSTPDELRTIVERAATAAAMLGHGRKECLDVERPNREPSRRALHLARSRRPGDVVQPEDIVVLRPATGIAPGCEHALIGATMGRHAEAGSAFQWSDLGVER
jgi:sialic acid synthase SpsE